MSSDENPNLQAVAKAPPAWLKRLLPFVFVIGALAVWWSPSGAPSDAPSRACATITRAEFDAALAAGAVRGTARVAADGKVDMSFGPGVVSCATMKGSAIKPCKRPTDLVIEYTPAGTAPFFVKVPAGSEYRFRVERAPNTCEILER